MSATKGEAALTLAEPRSRASELSPPSSKPKRAPRKPPTLSRLGQKEESAEAKRLAAILLEVLSGFRTPTAAAGVLGVSLPRYYALEARALEGFLQACKPLARGPHKTPEREVAKLKAELTRLERDCARYQGLLRAERRALGIAVEAKAKELPGKKRRRRRPTLRALKAAAILREAPAANALEKGARKEEDTSRAEA
jgi:hypothetical protein